MDAFQLKKITENINKERTIIKLNKNTHTKNIVYLINKTIASYYYRALMPLHNLANLAYNNYNLFICKKHQREAIEKLNPDLIVIQRALTENDLDYIKSLQQICRVGVDFDDDFLSIHETSPCYNMKTKYSETIKKIYNQADFLIASTKYLQSQLQKYNKNTCLFKNYADFDMYKVNFMPDALSKNTFFYTGSNTHLIDVNATNLGKSVKTLINKYNKTFIFQGLTPKLNLKKGKEQNLKQLEMVKLYHYFDCMCQARANYGILPLADIKFNKSKSIIKLYEYILAGKIPITLRNNNIYEKILTQEETGYIFDNFNQIKDINGDDYYRILRNAVDMIEKLYEIKNNVHKLHKIFDNM